MSGSRTPANKTKMKEALHYCYLLSTSDVLNEGEAVVAPGGMFGLALDTLPAFAVILNALVRGISTDNNPDSLVWLVLEMCFLVVFLLEFVIKLCIFGLTLTFCGLECWWNAFDMCILAGVIDTVSTFVVGSAKTKGLMMIKLLRLSRLTRLVRLLKYDILLN